MLVHGLPSGAPTSLYDSRQTLLLQEAGLGVYEVRRHIARLNRDEPKDRTSMDCHAMGEATTDWRP